MMRERWTSPAITLVLLTLLLWSMGDLELLDGERLRRGAANIVVFTGDMLPPDLSVLERVSRSMVETIQIAFAGTLLGFVLALPLALAASDVIAGRVVGGLVKLLLAFIRTVPSLLWAIVFVVAVGLGPAAGTLAIALYSAGYMGKLFYETFEGVDYEVIEAVRGVGSNRLQLARFALLPEAANAVLAQLLFMFEYNVRASSIMGFVGAGGVGYYLRGYMETLQYDRLLTTVLVTLVVVVAIDRASARLRRRFLATPTTA